MQKVGLNTDASLTIAGLANSRGLDTYYINPQYPLGYGIDRVFTTQLSRRFRSSETPPNYDAVLKPDDFCGGAMTSKILRSARTDPAVVILCDGIWETLLNRQKHFQRAEALYHLPAGLCGDEWCVEGAGRSRVVLRLAGLHGAPRQSGIVHAFIARALEDLTISVSAPQSCYSLLNVGDAAASDKPNDPGYFISNIAELESYELGAPAKNLRSLCGSRSAIEADAADLRLSFMAIDAARQALGFHPIPVDEWLRSETDKFAKPE